MNSLAVRQILSAIIWYPFLVVRNATERRTKGETRDIPISQYGFVFGMKKLHLRYINNEINEPTLRINSFDAT